MVLTSPAMMLLSLEVAVYARGNSVTTKQLANFIHTATHCVIHMSHFTATAGKSFCSSRNRPLYPGL
jgi:hypothetical protein